MGSFQIGGDETEHDILSTYVSGTQVDSVPYINSFMLKTPKYDTDNYSVFLRFITSVGEDNVVHLNPNANNEVDLLCSTNLNDFTVADYGITLEIVVRRSGPSPNVTKNLILGGSLVDSDQVFDPNLHLVPGGELDLTGYNFNFSF